MFIKYSICNFIHKQLKFAFCIIIQTHPLLLHTSKLKKQHCRHISSEFLKAKYYIIRIRTSDEKSRHNLIRKPKENRVLVRRGTIRKTILKLL